jgi:hypothetical protein
LNGRSTPVGAAPGSGPQDPGVTVRIAGGLGNQMFQYAAGRALAHRLCVPLTLDLRFFDRGRHRRYGLDALPLAPHHVLGRQDVGRWARWLAPLQRAGERLRGRTVPTYREPHFHVDEAFFGLRAPVRIQGHFQSQRYFETLARALRQELMPPVPTDALSQDLARAMAEAESAALHVRRGDYLSEPKNRALFAECGPGYHEAAMARLPPGCRVYVFSDDMTWCRQHLPRSRPLVFVEDGQPRGALADLWLMTQARHHVIANSSLSWWGAWLARDAGAAGAGAADRGRIAVAPRRWFVDPRFDDRDLVPGDWVRV